MNPWLFSVPSRDATNWDILAWIDWFGWFNCSKKNRQDKGKAKADNDQVDNVVVDGKAVAETDQPLPALERDQLVKLKKAMEQLQLQVQKKFKFQGDEARANIWIAETKYAQILA